MNEQLVGWFEDLIPEIKKSGDVEGVFMKFANDKNLAPALLEKLGHVYNTAKTVNYLDKSASHSQMRGDSFKLLDVPALLEKYAANASDDHEYESSDFSSFDSGSFRELTPQPKSKGVDFESLMNAPDYEEVKIASDRSKDLLSESIQNKNADNIDQLTFELSEDNEKIAGEIISDLRSSSNEFTFADIESDAIKFMGASVKSACDFVAERFEKLGYSFDRCLEPSSDIIEDTSYVIKFASIQDNLNVMEQAAGVKKNSADPVKTESETDLFKQSSTGTKNKNKSKSDSSRGSRASSRARINEEPTQYLTEIAENSVDDPAGVAIRGASNTAEFAAGAGSTLKDVAMNATGFRPGTTLPEALAYARDNLLIGPLDSLTGGYAGKQEFIDKEMEEVHYETMLQDLLVTDPILAEEDEDRIVNAFNTIKAVAPELAKDKNVMRMALRQAAQHEGIDPFTLQQYMEAEKELQKVRHNTMVEKDLAYTPASRDKRLAN